MKDCINYDDYILITVNINFNGCIYDNIKIENIDISSLGFQFDFRNFLISTFDFVDGDIESISVKSLPESSLLWKRCTYFYYIGFGCLKIKALDINLYLEGLTILFRYHNRRN